MLLPSGGNNNSRDKMAIPRTKHPDTNPALLSASASVVQTVLTLHTYLYIDPFKQMTS